MNTKRSPSPFGRLGIAGFSLAAFFVLMQIVQGFLRSGQEEGSALLAIGIGLNYFLWLAVPLSVAMLLWRATGVVRETRLRRRFPESEVLTAGRSSELPDRIAQLRGSKFRKLSFTAFPASVSLVLDTSALSVWMGVIEPFEVFRFEWRDVENLRAIEIAELGRSSAGLGVTVSHEKALIELPFIVMGRGFAGLFPESKSRLEMLSERFKPAN